MLGACPVWRAVFIIFEKMALLQNPAISLIIPAVVSLPSTDQSARNLFLGKSGSHFLWRYH